MNDNLSIDDIVAEYNEKKRKAGSVPEPEDDAAFAAEEAVPVIPEKDVGEQTADEEKAGENAELIQKLMQARREQGLVSPESEETPVKRTDPKDIEMGLTEKIIPRTDEFERVTDIPNDLSYEERSEMLKNKRQKRVDAFRLKDRGDDVLADEGP